MARIEIVDQTLRDGQQSYWGMRMQAGQMLPVADAIDCAGYRVVDLTGSSIFEVMVRFRQENPWKGLDAIRAALPNSTLRAGTRTNGIVGMNVTPDSIVELWIRTLAKHGIESLWIFDCLHDAENMIRVAKIARDAGLAPSPQLNFSESPVHTDDYYADVIDRMIAGDAAETIILGDEAGVLGPERARRWIRQSQERAAAGGTPLEMHFHNRTAMANLNHIIGVEEGVHDRPLGDLDPRQRRLDALDRGHGRQHAPARPRGRGRRQPLRRGRRALRRPRRRRRLPARRPGRVPGRQHPAAVPGRDDGDAARTAEAGEHGRPAAGGAGGGDPGPRGDGLADHGDAVLAAGRDPGAAQRRPGRALRDDPRGEPDVPGGLVREAARRGRPRGAGKGRRAPPAARR